MIDGFLPVYDENSRILILGSFPSVLSRKNAFYYGNPRNRFWGLLSELFDDSSGSTKKSKTAFLLRHKIALWDVVLSCEIVGSLDANIKNPVVADVAGLIGKTRIEKILCNGQKSYALLKKHFPHLIGLAVSLPSTSPANVRFARQKWEEALLK